MNLLTFAVTKHGPFLDSWHAYLTITLEKRTRFKPWWHRHGTDDDEFSWRDAVCGWMWFSLGYNARRWHRTPVKP